jgi:hypothetical protein
LTGLPSEVKCAIMQTLDPASAVCLALTSKNFCEVYFQMTGRPKFPPVNTRAALWRNTSHCNTGRNIIHCRQLSHYLVEWMGPNWVYSIEREKFVAKQGMQWPWFPGYDEYPVAQQWYYDNAGIAAEERSDLSTIPRRFFSASYGPWKRFP